MSKKVSLKEFANKYNTRTNRRGHKMSEGYLYRIIREDIRGERTGKKEPIWFNYVLEGDKDHIYILV